MCVGNISCKTGDQEFLIIINTSTDKSCGNYYYSGNIYIIKYHRDQILEELSLYWRRTIMNDSVDYSYINFTNFDPSVSNLVLYNRLGRSQRIDERSYDIIKEKIFDLEEKHGAASSSRSSFVDSENLLIQIGKMLLENKKDQLINL